MKSASSLCLLTCLLACAGACAETFLVPVEADAGYVVETDWKGTASLFETRLSTGERAMPPLVGPFLRLRAQDRDQRDILNAIFADVDRADGQAECHLSALLVLCRYAQNLAIKSRAVPGSSSEPFVTRTGFLACIDGINGRGACKDVLPPRPKLP